MRKRFFLLILAIVPLLLWVRPASAASCTRNPGSDVYVCDVRPQQPVFAPSELRQDSLFDHRNYAWLEDYAPLYRTPGGEVVDEGTEGLLYYTVEETATDAAGNRWYQVDPERWAAATDMYPYEESKFSGITVLGDPVRPFGWLLEQVQPSPAPDAEPAPGAAFLQRYTFVQIYDVAKGDDGWLWFDIGQDQWVKQPLLGLVDVSSRPAEVGEDEFWVEVDLFEQTFAAYEGDKLVYATLVSSGLDKWPTNEGLFTVYSRHSEWPMLGGDVGTDYYYLQDVPHTLFFDNEIALHGAYWHDRFGYQRSHGCVNMPPRDAEWLYYWSWEAPEHLVWVYVHSRPQNHFLERYDGILSGNPF